MILALLLLLFLFPFQVFKVPLLENDFILFIQEEWLTQKQMFKHSYFCFCFNTWIRTPSACIINRLNCVCLQGTHKAVLKGDTEMPWPRPSGRMQGDSPFHIKF